MKKIYVLSVVCLLVLTSGYAQTFTWVGGSGNNWSTAANWTGSTGFPNSASVNVIFNSNAQVNLDVASLNVNTLTISNSSTVKLTSTAAGGAAFQVNSSSAVTPGLSVEAGSRLIDSAIAASPFEFIFSNSAKGEISGEWYFTGNNDDDGFSFFTLPQASGQTAKLNVNSGGYIIFTNNSFPPDNNNNAAAYLEFKAGSFLQFARNGGIVPRATYAITSTVLITGFVNQGLQFDQASNIGNLTYASPAQAGPLSLSLLNINVRGNLHISNTNNQRLTIVGNGAVFNTAINVVIEKELIIDGNSAVALSSVDANNKVTNLVVQGNMTMDGNSFSLQTNNSSSIDTTILTLKANLIHSSGTFTASSTATNNAKNIFIVEMNSTVPQSISSVTGTIDNAAHQVTLRINNSSATGVTLSTPLQVGRISFNSLLKGKLTTTSSNILTINNTSGNALVVENSAGFDGFVNGPLRRNTTGMAALLMPTGKGSAYRPVTIIPAAAGTNTYEATYFNTAHPNADQLLTPMKGVSSVEYWEVTRPTGTAGAQVQFTLAGALSGASATDFIIVSKFTGGQWTNAKGATGTAIAGNSTNGTVQSEAQSSFSFFTFGYVAQSALPTILVSFTAKKEDDHRADLKWKITDNSTPEHFDVLKSTDGVNFSGIGSVGGVTGQFDYAFTDAHLSTGNNYYRLKMSDKDGSITLSNIITIINGVKGVIISSLMPSIVNDRTRLSVSSSINARIQLVVTDIHGRIVQQQSASIAAGSQEIWINAAALPGGLYQVTGFIDGEKTKTLRFIKK